MLIVSTVGYCFLVWREKIDVEHWMNAPLRGKFQPVIYWGHHLDNLKRFVVSRPELGHRLSGMEVLAF